MEDTSVVYDRLEKLFPQYKRTKLRFIYSFFNDADTCIDFLSTDFDISRVGQLAKIYVKLGRDYFLTVKDKSKNELQRIISEATLKEKYGTLENAYKLQQKTREETFKKDSGTLEEFYKKRNETRIESNLKNFGRKSITNIEKQKKTLEEKYGVENIMQKKEFVEKSRQTRNERYSEKEIHEKARKTCLEKYGVENPFQDPNFVHNHPTHISSDELDLRSFLDSLHVEYRTSVRDIIRLPNQILELDIYIPSKNVAVEFNGLYWHSDKFKPKDYHQLKSRLCREKGIRLLHIFSDMWSKKNDICKSLIKSSLGIYDRKVFARKCEVREIASKTYREFLDQNHIQGAVNSSLRLGLFYKDELLQVIGFGGNRFSKGEYELHRMCTKLNTQVIGGFSKLIRHSNVKDFVSYVDLSLFDGSGYFALGFEKVAETVPSYWYIDKGATKRLSRISCQKSKLKSLLGENFDSRLSEKDNMEKNGYFRVYDSGCFKLKYHKD